jgi:SAM-dependent methyltransferase
MSQQHFWNEKFSQKEYMYGKNPNAFIKSCKHYFDKSKRFLCLGEGEGRNAIYFAKRGFEITALDASNIGLRKLKDFADQENVKVLTECIDLNHWAPSHKYGSIVASYLHMHKNDHKALFKKIEDALEENGYFVGEFFSKDQLNYTSGGPKNEELLYDTNDFEEDFPKCKKIQLEKQIIHLDEGYGHKGEASVIRVVLQKQS